MVEGDFAAQWDRLLFRDYLICFPEVARQYARLKERLAEDHRQDRIAYTRGKTEFLAEVTERARRYFERT
jgi:GrpB-like predicted nucleotidyltransferase (UPF0157 family)